LDVPVTSVTIENGSPAICSNILLGRGTVDEIIIGGKVCVSFNTNDARFDLNFTLVGYSCEFIGSDVYSVNGLPVDFVRFDRFN
jgi:hypothetical protein